LNRNIFGLLVS